MEKTKKVGWFGSRPGAKESPEDGAGMRAAAALQQKDSAAKGNVLGGGGVDGDGGGGDDGEEEEEEQEEGNFPKGFRSAMLKSAATGAAPSPASVAHAKKESNLVREADFSCVKCSLCLPSLASFLTLGRRASPLAPPLCTERCRRLQGPVDVRGQPALTLVVLLAPRRHPPQNCCQSVWHVPTIETFAPDSVQPSRSSKHTSSGSSSRLPKSSNPPDGYRSHSFQPAFCTGPRQRESAP